MGSDLSSEGGIFKQGTVIHLTSQSSMKNLRFNGTVEGRGGMGKFAKWKIHHPSPGHVKFESISHPGKYLRINHHGHLDMGGGGGMCSFKPINHGNHVFSFQSVKHHNWHVGVLPNGNAKNGKNTGTGMHSRFKVVHATGSGTRTGTGGGGGGVHIKIGGGGGHHHHKKHHHHGHGHGHGGGGHHHGGGGHHHHKGGHGHGRGGGGHNHGHKGGHHGGGGHHHGKRGHF